MERRLTDQISNSSGNYQSVIGGKTKIKGNISGDNELRFEGQFEGEINLSSLLIVERQGNVGGRIEVDNLILEGKAEGELVVKNKVEVRASGHFEGDIMCKTIAIEEGAFFQGNIKMADGRHVTPTYFKEKRKDLQED